MGAYDGLVVLALVAAHLGGQLALCRSLLKMGEVPLDALDVSAQT